MSAIKTRGNLTCWGRPQLPHLSPGCPLEGVSQGESDVDLVGHAEPGVKDGGRAGLRGLWRPLPQAACQERSEESQAQHEPGVSTSHGQSAGLAKARAVPLGDHVQHTCRQAEPDAAHCQRCRRPHRAGHRKEGQAAQPGGEQEATTHPAGGFTDPTVRDWAARGPLDLVPDAKPARVSTTSLARVVPLVKQLQDAGQDRDLLRALIERLEEERVRSLSPSEEVADPDATGRLRTPLECRPLTAAGFRVGWTPLGRQAAGRLRSRRSLVRGRGRGTAPDPLALGSDRDGPLASDAH
jgi:hypothetical protein